MVSVKVYAKAPATQEAQAAAIAAHRADAAQALATGAGNLPTSTAKWVRRIDAFTRRCNHNNALAVADRNLVGTLEQRYGDHWRFGFELIRAGTEAAMVHQQARVRNSNNAKRETDAYQRLLTSFQVAMTTFHAFGNPMVRGPSIH